MSLTPESLLDKALNLEIAGDLTAARVLYEQVAECDSAHAEIAKHNLLRLQQQPSAEADDKKTFASSGKPRKQSGRKRRTKSWNSRMRSAWLHPGFVIGGLLLASVIFTPGVPAIGALSVLLLLGGLLYPLFVIFGRQDCDLCGVRATCRKYNPLHEDDQNTNAGHRSFALTLPGSDRGGFALCPKCTLVAEASETPIEDLIAQAVPQRQIAEGAKRTAANVRDIGILLLIGAVLFGLWFFYKNFETRRSVSQVPVSVDVRASLIGVGNVVQIRNKSDQPIRGVGIILENTGKNMKQAYRLDDINAGEVAEYGTIETDWKVSPGDRITIVAEGFDPIVFTGNQLGVE